MRIFCDFTDHETVGKVIDRVFIKIHDDNINVENLTLLEKPDEWAITGPLDLLMIISREMEKLNVHFLLDNRPVFIKGMPDILRQNIIMAVEYDRAYRLTLRNETEGPIGNSKKEQPPSDKKGRAKRKATK
jgi:hypothetical protein